MEQLIAAAISTRNLIGEPETAIQDMEKWIRRVAEQNAELALFPELNVTGYIPNAIAQEIAETVPGPSTEKIIRLAERYQMNIAFGLIERDGSNLHCTHVLVNGNGIIGKQAKIHVPAQEQPYWSAGDTINVFDIGKAKIGIAICRDSFFDEMTRTFYFKGAEIVLMPFGYYNVPRGQYLKETIHGMSLVKSAWANGYYELVCNSAGDRDPSFWEPNGRKFPGWAGIIDPWGSVIEFVDRDGNDESMVIQALSPLPLDDRRQHPNFLAKELRVDLYKFC
jgi:N-carbamoylputrescine amidase